MIRIRYDKHLYNTVNINWPIFIYLAFGHIFALYAFYDLMFILNRYLLLELYLWHSITGFGVTAGMHRLWSHRSYKAKYPTRFLLMILASISNQGSIYHWCRDQRIHHKHSDTVSDPHNINNGIFYSHMGWLLLKKSNNVKNAGNNINCQDLMDDWIVKLNYQLNPLWNQFWCFIFPGLYGLWRYNSFYRGMLLFGILRWVIMLNCTWCVNSVAHTFGYRPYKNIRPTESLITSFLAVGEGWHNWHHAYPYDYAASEYGIFYRWNPTKLLIDFLWLIGQTYDLKRVSIQKNPL